ncbi:MAG: hypothetical protein N0C90_09770, partial [Candidatus Thiodiazotropha endolucinida]|nr:hypothetical protein [Candidatus Thiodiazotropha taylori]MCW4261647.1 hypothetical protein [Candidatus Thiodiazotropha endolucinida]
GPNSIGKNHAMLKLLKLLYWFKQYLFISIDKHVTTIHELIRTTGFENKRNAYANHLLLRMSGCEWHAA